MYSKTFLKHVWQPREERLEIEHHCDRNQAQFSGGCVVNDPCKICLHPRIFFPPFPSLPITASAAAVSPPVVSPSTAKLRYVFYILLIIAGTVETNLFRRRRLLARGRASAGSTPGGDGNSSSSHAASSFSNDDDGGRWECRGLQFRL